MEDIQNQELETPKENPEEEQELLKETPADEVRLSITEKYGLNEEVDDELINKLVEGEIESSKRLSTAIKQKIGWRTKAGARTEQKPEDKPQPQTPKVEDDKTFDQRFNEKFEEKELQSLDISDELKQEVKTYAKATGLTINKTLKSDYFKFLEEKEKAKNKVEEATIGGKRRAPSRQEFDAENPPEVDMSTEAGRATWDNYLKSLK